MVAAAGMAFMMAAAFVCVPFPVVAALRIRIVLERACKQGFHLGIGIAGSTRIKLDTGFGQGAARAATDSAADQGIHAQLFEESGQSAVAVPICRDDLVGNNFAACGIVNLKLFRVAEVLEYVPVFICDRNFHGCNLR